MRDLDRKRQLESNSPSRTPYTSRAKKIHLEGQIRTQSPVSESACLLTASEPLMAPSFSEPEGLFASMLPQPDTRPITPEQLVNEVKGIYSGLDMVEKKCVEITTKRAATGAKLGNEQWQALIALHRTLLHEHHDFFLASQHPTASPALRRLATKYAMPARMWRDGIHAFLELLRQQLPDPHDHMLAFVYNAHSMMSLLIESVPSFLETWIECLGDLARYRMAIEEVDLRDREIWSHVARMWYNKAADRSPNVGRIQHHLAVLARPDVVCQLFLYSKVLVSVISFPHSRESIIPFSIPFLNKENHDRVSKTESSRKPIQSISARTYDASLSSTTLESWRLQCNRAESGTSYVNSRSKDWCTVCSNANPQGSSKEKTKIIDGLPGVASWFVSFRPRKLTSCLSLITVWTALAPLVRGLPTDVEATNVGASNDVKQESPTLAVEVLNAFIAWGPPTIFAVLVLVVSSLGASRDDQLVYALFALMSAIIAITFGNNGAPAQFQYPSFGAAIVFQWLYMRASFPRKYRNLKLPIGLLAAGVAGATLLGQISAPKEGLGLDHFLPMLPISLWLVITVANGLSQVMLRRNATKDEENDGQDDNVDEATTNAVEMIAPGGEAG